MRRKRDPKLSGPLRRRNAHVAAVGGRTTRAQRAAGKRARGTQRNDELPFSPPEDWYEPADGAGKDHPHDYRIVVQPPGRGYRHVVTPQEIRDRLRQLPSDFVALLEVIQLSRMTRKKEQFACYGMQWGTALYLYPMESDRVEVFYHPPKPSQIQEAHMYGGRWIQLAGNHWKLVWTEQALKDYYLNNILIHELGHLLDERNSTYADRERFAEWFAVEYGYRRTPRRDRRRFNLKTVRRRHHCC